MNKTQVLNRAADNIRILAAAAVEKAKSGHPGGAMGGADFINVLFSEFLEYDPDNAGWEARDRFFLDPGHMAPMLYGQLCLAGKFTLEDLKNSMMLCGHPHYIEEISSFMDEMEKMKGAVNHNEDDTDLKAEQVEPA